MFHEKGPTFFELARQALSSTTRGYDLLAPKFEYTPFRTPDELLGPLAEAAGREPVDRALDCCCGTGAIARALRPYVSEEILGIDLSAGMLEKARQLAEEAEGDARMRFEVMDALEMPFVEEFDVVATAGAFGHILPPDQDRFLVRVKRALRPGGRFMFVTRPMPKMTSKAWLFARGFNAAMHVRNALIKPEFIMFYLTFTVERATRLLERHSFDVTVESPYGDTPWPAMRLMIGRKR
jgi:ubiquinone/menaquinone biosynthesis C-methylase UbiE